MRGASSRKTRNKKPLPPPAKRGGRIPERSVPRLTGRQKLWVEEYLVDLQGTQAALRAGYSPKHAAAASSMNLRHPAVIAYLQHRMAARAQRCEISQDRVLEEARRLALVSMRDLVEWDECGEVRVRPSSEISPEAAAAIQEIHSVRTESPSGEVTHRLKLKLHSKPDALKLLGQHLGMFSERHEHILRGAIQHEHRKAVERSLKELPVQELVALRAKLRAVLPEEVRAPAVEPKEL